MKCYCLRRAESTRRRQQVGGENDQESGGGAKSRIICCGLANFGPCVSLIADGAIPSRGPGALRWRVEKFARADA